MKTPSRNYEIGRGRPPKEFQWAKGECGNPRRIRKHKPMDVALMIEKRLSAKINIVEGGTARRVSVFEAILLQLLLKATAGNKRAVNILLKCKEFAARRGGIGGVELRVEKKKS
jgi:Family of unknown function (DUF5681)